MTFENIEILVADDSSINLLMTSKVISSLGNKIHHAKDGNEVLQILENNTNIGLLILDLQMPGLDGYDTAIAMRNTDLWYQNLPIIALSASSNLEEKTKALNCGIQGYMVKPLLPKHLPELKTIFEKTGEQINGFFTEQTGLEKVYNLDYLHQVMEGKKDYALQLLDHTIHSISGIFESIFVELNQHNWLGLAAALHKLKGLLSIFTLSKILETVIELENKAERQDDALQNYFSTSLNELTHLIPEQLYAIKNEIINSNKWV